MTARRKVSARILEAQRSREQLAARPEREFEGKTRHQREKAKADAIADVDARIRELEQLAAWEESVAAGAS